MRFLAVSRLISILVSTLALGACIVDEWSEDPTVVSTGSDSKVPATATTQGGGTSYSTPDAGAPKTGDSSATSTIKAFGGGTIKGTAVFTQHGGDVTVRIDLTGCAEGSHLVQIFSGYSCDSIAEPGHPVEPAARREPRYRRGTIKCGADKKGSMTFTRKGGDPMTSWTVGDDNPTTDVTHQLIMIFAVDDPTQRHGCGDFL